MQQRLTRWGLATRKWFAASLRFMRNSVLGVDDTPHRIARGVALGFFIAFTPTLGFQIALYVATSWIVRANRVSGIPWLFLSNPFSAVPFYYFTWWIGNAMLAGGADSESGAAAVAAVFAAQGAADNMLAGMMCMDYWKNVASSLADIGLALWVGGLACSVVSAVIAYPVTYRIVVNHRVRRRERRASTPPLTRR